MMGAETASESHGWDISEWSVIGLHPPRKQRCLCACPQLLTHREESLVSAALPCSLWAFLVLPMSLSAWHPGNSTHGSSSPCCV
ncbi:hypothetical protein XENTR_v10017353 [Xenopus tropicalis]|nr:hypothetical protein XENTR_v10017353 [Xenopus tropicalis]